MDIFLFIRGFAALVFTLSLIGGIAFLAKRYGLFQQTRPGKQMQVLETCALDARHRIVLVRIGEATRAALIGPSSCQFLDEEIELSALPELASTKDANAAPATPTVIGWQAALQAIAPKIAAVHDNAVKRAAQ